MPNAVKEKFVHDFTEDLKKSDHVLVTHYQGMNSEEFNDLRNQLRKTGAKYKVVKNRLAKIALNNIGWNLDPYLKGPSAIAYQGDDVSAITKTLYSISKKNKKLKVVVGHLFGQVTEEKDLKAIADLPSREVLLATLAARLNSPLQTLMATLNEPMRSLHAAVSAVAKKKEAAPSA